MGLLKDFTVCVATYGETRWADLAWERAIPSVEDGVRVIFEHGDTLYEARNAALAKVRTSFVIHLDADDELEGGYISAMARATGDMRVPLVRYVKATGRMFPPRRVAVAGHVYREPSGEWHQCTGSCLSEGNWMVIGTAVHADTLRQVGGWRDFPWSEDWDAWLRVWMTGASIELVDGAVYRAHVREDSRNRSAHRKVREATHRAIYEANFGHSCPV